ncbi:DUF3575 domain-containing protein [Chryseobacterium joostei]|uniref:DUF3575 domain-containing protein n=1 Tax=Chryseobacterium joostei TaxID=112234 RepID=A0A1N7I0M3_9FLAO|nr:DUF3575 domain-containing protein [Chryseobacterium joostei]AZA99355.1 DUF3575 domain-containing protein [Chryseobacterium joostei]SIS30609.1 Protein of unknown function [Chryseobacterium joostei]SIS46361.1 Protein of unknown function [Chryseobacterium joostei]
MKKNFLLAMILFAFYSVNAQNTKTNEDPSERKNEIKLNLITPLSGAVEAGFERYLNKNSSLGISAFMVYDNTKEDDLNYFISPYYRYYFGKKYASGFFAEGFGMFTSIDGKKIYAADNIAFTESKNVYDLALGAGLGWKLVTKKGIVFEANAAYGRLVFNADKTDHDQVIKLGLSMGYRF